MPPNARTIITATFLPVQGLTLDPDFRRGDDSRLGQDVLAVIPAKAGIQTSPVVFKMRLNKGVEYVAV